MQQAGRDRFHLAKRVGVSEDVFAEWERGEAHPTVGQLRLIAQACRLPFAVFFLRDAPPIEPLPKDRRTLPDAESALSLEAIQAVREAQRLQLVALELREVLGLGESSLSGFEAEPPEQFAARVIEYVGLQPFGTPLKSDEALRRRIQALEAKGAIVLRMSLPIKEVRAFALPGPVAAIVLNSKDSSNGQSFSLIHELAHLLLSQDGLCLPGDVEVHLGSGIEVFCNAVAGAVLVPMQDLVNHPLVSDRQLGLGVSTEEIAAIAASFCVSREVVLRRLLGADLLSKERYEREASGLVTPERPPKGRGNWLTTLLNRNGEAVSRLVVEAIGRNVISETDAAQYLNTRIDYLPKIEERLARRAAL
jgi:Zn-dependent peptidase ImmA (M78 family)